MMARLVAFMARVRWMLHGGTTLDAIPGGGEVTALLYCTHAPRFWSRCYADGYRYCTNCWAVRVRC